MAVILDDFSSEAFRYEWNQVSLTRNNWRKQLESELPDLLFVESAWAGNDGEWRYQLTGETGPKTDFRELIAYCRSKGVPTVFWNKEDPPHYEDFLDAARLFDIVFTSDSNRIESYVRDLGHSRVAVLQFAAQPVLHNPVRPVNGWHQLDVAFAGMYFAHKFPERRAQLELLLGAAHDAHEERGIGLDIFSRHAGADPNYKVPAPYDKYVAGTLPYAEMLTAYKAYRVFLNVNSVVDSPSMCARRIYELTAAGTSVVSTPSLALTQWAPEEQFTATSRTEASELIQALVRNPQLSDRQLHRAQRRVWSEHTYAHRVESIVAAALPAESARPVVEPSASLLVSTFRPGQLEHVFNTVGSLLGRKPELVLCTHGFEVDKNTLQRLKDRSSVEDLVLLDRPSSATLGECLNACVDAAGGEVLSKMDDDDLYAPNYLRDLVHALTYSGADIVGKQAHYMYLARHHATLLRFAEREHRFTPSVMGPTITGGREVFLKNPFQAVNRGEDTAFLNAVLLNGGRIYSGDRFNYAQFRGPGNHTWKISDAALLASGEIQFFGTPNNHIAL
ncbi:glycosyltransferase [Arthrobacter sp. zg-Y1143]|uniref:glycosyltransferase family protein n=1 Tax=Arthrobacter sp. zg-Y1143 TaxID=3049065 RepID=UPI0024C31A60|nr:glycosyltransferase [Arthrobacter sp. zg-Y1143]MDK1329050.1 glycosyltransferase [Arthrobacter sp. zg-Y1143]